MTNLIKFPFWCIFNIRSIYKFYIKKLKAKKQQKDSEGLLDYHKDWKNRGGIPSGEILSRIKTTVPKSAPTHNPYVGIKEEDKKMLNEGYPINSPHIKMPKIKLITPKDSDIDEKEIKKL